MTVRSRILSMSLAAQWLARFSGLQLPAGVVGVSGSLDSQPAADLPSQAHHDGFAAVPPTQALPDIASPQAPREQTFVALFEYWRIGATSTPIG
ncbi:hypothetical protein THIX_90547 [Thiomonas sp. X19]|uniref:hypothetical protein n=1 Tax=Thiomonas sp. X19 TaxID=1050370 RepID=UPI000B6A3B7D|nr:hypothetical protein [Thiomonas sp. X19]SCC95772.1 hypothetical protein THIX_90547 [Thiomonas sp. X19]